MTVNYKVVKEFLESSSCLSDLSDRVRESLYERRVLKLVCGDNHYWFFNSKERDYLIVPKLYCSCMDFELNVITRGSKKYCYHIITQRCAEVSGMFKELLVDSETLNDIVTEVVYVGRSNTLRKLLI